MIGQGSNISRFFWICQLAGWTLYGVITALGYKYFEMLDLNFYLLLSIGIMTYTGVLLSYLFRLVIKAQNWFTKPILEVIALTLLSNVVLGVLFTATNYLVDYKLLRISGNVPDTMYFVFAVINQTVFFMIWSLIYFATHYFNSNRQREIEHLKWEGAIKDFELNKLKSQLNPHFVFNALNTIRALVDEDPEKAKKSITQLSNILRSSLLADRSKTITLMEEMKTVNDYINLEKLRYEERMNVMMDIAPEAMHVQVPPMMIQTVVENAVKHGISRLLGEGFIGIDAHVISNKLTVTIKNTGQLGTNDPVANSTGFGIINTKHRLELLYGEEASFSILQSGDNEVCAKLVIPIMKFNEKKPIAASQAA